MMQFLNSLSNKEWYITLTAFLSINLGTIITGVICIVKNSITTNRIKAAVIETLEKNNVEINERTEKKIDAILVKVESVCDVVTEKIDKKLKLDKQEKEEQLALTTSEFNDSIDKVIDLDKVEVK